MATRNTATAAAAAAAAAFEGDSDEWALRTGQPAPAMIELDAEDSIIERIKSLIATNGDDIKIKLYRKDPKRTGLEWCDDFTPSEFESGDLSLIRDKWGSGQYEIRLIGKKGIITKSAISIAETRSNPIAIAAPQQNNELAQVLQLMQQQQQQILTALTQRPDPIAQLQPMLALMLQFKEVMAPQTTAPKNQLSDIVAAIRELREVSSEINPPTEKEPESLMGMVSQMLPMIAAGMQRGQTPVMQELPAVTVPAAFTPLENAAPVATTSAAAPAPAIETPQNLTPEQNAMIEQLRAVLNEFLTHSGNPAMFVEATETLYEKLPDDLFPLLENPDWFNGLCMFAPECAKHQQWLTFARDQMLRWAAEDAADPAPAAAPAAAPAVP